MQSIYSNSKQSGKLFSDKMKQSREIAQSNSPKQYESDNASKSLQSSFKFLFLLVLSVANHSLISALQFAVHIITLHVMNSILPMNEF